MSGYSVEQHKFGAALNIDGEFVWKERLNTPEEDTNGLSKVAGGGGASDDRQGVFSTLPNVKEQKAASGCKQWHADKCSTTGSIYLKKKGSDSQHWGVKTSTMADFMGKQWKQ